VRFINEDVLGIHKLQYCKKYINLNVNLSYRKKGSLQPEKIQMREDPSCHTF
jgi:hypothetical protein